MKQSAGKIGSAPKVIVSFLYDTRAFKHAAHHPQNIAHFAADRAGAGDKHQIPPCFCRWLQLTVRFADDSPGPVACDGFSDLFAGGDTNAVAPKAIARIIQHQAGMHHAAPPVIQAAKIPVFRQRYGVLHRCVSPLSSVRDLAPGKVSLIFPPRRPLRPAAIKKDHRKVAFVSIGQHLSAFCTASGKHFAAVAGRHPVAETVFAFSVNFFRLIRSEHNPPPFCMILIPDIIPYPHEDCQQFFSGKKNRRHHTAGSYICKNSSPAGSFY